MKLLNENETLELLNYDMKLLIEVLKDFIQEFRIDFKN